LELKPKSHQKIIELIQRGVDIPNPVTLDIGEELRNERISSKDVKSYPWKKESSPF
jgi:UDP-N-acetylglucosamine/UDP-N-acetylgalactosamine diphosphorylase